MDSIVITLLKIEDGFCKVSIKPAVGHSYFREFSRKALTEYLEETKNYCAWKGYEFTYHDKTESQERLYSKNSEGEEENEFILVESQYIDPKDGAGKPDAVSFTIGQYLTDQPEKKHPFEYDNMICVSTE